MRALGMAVQLFVRFLLEHVYGLWQLFPFSGAVTLLSLLREVMSIVEAKVPGFFTELWREKDDTFDQKQDLHGDWGTSTIELTQEDRAGGESKWQS